MQPAQDPFQTKSSRVYSELRQAITTGEYKPNQHLVRRNLTKRFGVSLSIVNEALARLVNDGLVESKEMYGTRVVSLDERGLQEEFVMREAVERHTARLLAESATDETFEHLLSEARSLDRWMSGSGRNKNEGSMLHLEFHLTLARSTGFTVLEEALKRSGIRSLMTTRWLENLQVPHPANFHEQLVRAFMRRDPVLADKKMHEHLHYGRSIAERDVKPAQRASRPPRGALQMPAKAGSRHSR